MEIFQNIDMQRFMDSFQYMGKGMLCIFVVIGVLAGVVQLLNKWSAKSEKKKNDNESQTK